LSIEYVEGPPEGMKLREDKVPIKEGSADGGCAVM